MNSVIEKHYGRTENYPKFYCLKFKWSVDRLYWLNTGIYVYSDEHMG